jgi:hypothetical protein
MVKSNEIHYQHIDNQCINNAYQMKNLRFFMVMLLINTANNDS